MKSLQPVNPAVVAILLATVCAAPAEEPRSAEQLIAAWGCLSCHHLNGFGGSLAPDLSKVGARLNSSDIKVKLQPLPGQNSGALMPTYPEMSAEEVERIASYLSKRT